MSTPPQVGPLTDHGLATLSFKVQPLQFDLNRDLKYVSMKDQIIRARTFILAARTAGLLGEPKFDKEHEPNVIVFGGGISGISAALAVCEIGYSATVIESSNRCFPILGLGTDRLFSATVYDWPHRHFADHEFPYLASLRDATLAAKILGTKPAVLRFPQTPLTAAKLRSHLLSQLLGFQKRFGSALHVLHSHILEKPTHVWLNHSSKVVASKVLDSKGVEQHFESSVVIFAMGFGLDKEGQQTAAAREFFSYADLTSDIKVALASPSKRVRIEGAGDGGLQEALRFVLKESFHDLNTTVDLLEAELAAGNPSSSWRELLIEVQSVEDHAVKSLMWGYTEETVFEELHNIYLKIVKTLISRHHDAIVSWAEKVLRDASLTIELSDPWPFSGRVYALNRFLTMLVERLPVIKGKTKLERVLSSKQSKSAAVEPSAQIGTASADDLLRRLAFQSIPMNLDAVR